MATLGELLTSKIPPHSLEAERAVLGAILLERESLPAGHRAPEALRLLQGGPSEDLRHHAGALRAQRAGGPPHAVRGAQAPERPRRGGWAGCPRGAGGGGGHLRPPHRVRRHRPGEGAPARPHPRIHRGHLPELRRQPGGGETPRRRRAPHLPDLRAPDAGLGLPGARHPQGHLRAHRAPRTSGRSTSPGSPPGSASSTR